MSFATKIEQQFEASIETKQQSLKVLSSEIEQAITLLVDVLTNDHKILICGNGSSAANSQHFAAELLGRFERERPGLAAMALTADTAVLTALGSDYSFDEVYARQVRSLGQPGDVLVVLSVNDQVQNIISAIEAAKERDMTVLALTGKQSALMLDCLCEEDLLLSVPSEHPARIKEVHLLLLHCLCDGIDCALFGDF